MWASTRTVSLQGAVGHVIDVQVDVSHGQIATHLVGRADASINEARDRCRSAIQNSGDNWPTSRRITILLSPADLPKRGPHFDLAIAIAVLAASGKEFPRGALDDIVMIGELSLDGRLRCVPGVLPMVMAAAARGIRRVVVPEPQVDEAALVPGVEAYGARSLGQVVAVLQGGSDIPEAPPVEPPTGQLLLSWRGEARLDEVDLVDVIGMADARFALEVAAVGGHHLMLTGPKKNVPRGKHATRPPSSALLATFWSYPASSCAKVLRMKALKVVGALLPLALVVSCGGGTDVKASDGSSANVANQSPSATSSVSTSSDPNLPSQDTLEKYFNGVGTDTLDSLKEALDAAQPGSPAFAYATYLQGFDQAAIDGGTPDDAAMDTTKIDGGFKGCQGTGSDATCYEYKDIEGAGGKVSNFTVNGKPLANRLTIGNGKAVPAQGGGSSATFIAAFESSSGSNFFVVVSIKAGSKGVGLVQAKYRSLDGRQSESSDDTGPSDLDPGALANFAFTFPSAKIGGTLTLTISDSDFNDSTVTLKTR